MPKDKTKHTIIVDADLHIQDPHDIILSYFNTGNDNQFVHGNNSQFRFRLTAIFVVMVLMEFFFQEMLKSFLYFILVAALSLIVGLITVYGVSIAAGALSRSAAKDGIRGIFYQLVFFSAIVLLLASFA